MSNLKLKNFFVVLLFGVSETTEKSTLYYSFDTGYTWDIEGVLLSNNIREW